MSKRPRERLEGIELEGGWIVGKRLRETHGATGGVFSEGYRVDNRDGDAAFLKAIDFYDAGFEPDPARALQPLIESFNFERDLLSKCREKNLDRVVRYITEGKVMLDGHAVQYLILELAERDIRGQIDLVRRIDLAWQLRVLHHIATGMRQLHSQRIAHQDLKPSNVLVFGDNVCKLGDLGKAAHPDYAPPHDEEDNPGDKSYSAPELLYGHTLSDWKRRRFGADLYLLGSMIVFIFTRASMTSLIQRELEHYHHWKIWRGSYEQVLPFVRDAFGRALLKVKDVMPPEIRTELMAMIRQLCDPDPDLRGHPSNRGVPYELERYLNELNILARKAELKLF
jgi:serine/threonine protein kinase